jgi:hypothetical protein
MHILAAPPHGLILGHLPKMAKKNNHIPRNLFLEHVWIIGTKISLTKISL